MELKSKLLRRVASCLHLAIATLALSVSAQTPLVWKGYVNSLWDNTTANWQQGGGGPIADNGVNPSVRFDETAFPPAKTNLNLTVTKSPAAMVVSNLNYTIGGTGALAGAFTLVKQGTGSLTLANTGTNTFTGGVKVNSGGVVFATDHNISGGALVAAGATLQVGTNNGAGLPPAGAITNHGVLIFNRGAGLTVAGVISGAGGVTKLDAGMLTLGGANSFTGIVAVAGGTLRAGHPSALGVTNGATIITNGATLDVNGSNLGGEPVFIADAGVSGGGAIVNSGADQTQALRTLTLLDDSALGGNGGRWDLRESAPLAADASLAGNSHTLAKVGTNKIAFAGVTVNPSLSELTVKQGTLSLEFATSIGGAGTLTVSNGATLAFFSNSVPLEMFMYLYGDGVTTTLLNNGGSPVIDNTVIVNSSAGDVIFGGNGVELNFDVGLSGPGGVIKNGNCQWTIAASALASYTGTTIVNKGALIVDGTKAAGAGLTIAVGATLGGAGAIVETTVVNGSLSPGNPLGTARGMLGLNGALTLNGSTNTFELSSNPSYDNDQLVVNNTLTLTGVNAFRILPATSFTVGDVYTLVLYNGAGSNVDTNHIVILSPPGYTVSLLDPATTPGAIEVQVTAARPPAPAITSLVCTGGNVVILGTNNNGTSPGTYHLLASTNAALALSNWTVLTNGSFDASGNFCSTNLLGGAARRFFVVCVP